MRNELRHIVTTALGTVVFMFLVLSVIAILSSGKIFDDGVESLGGSVPGSVSESVRQELPQPIGSADAPEGETLAAVAKQAHI